MQPGKSAVDGSEFAFFYTESQKEEPAMQTVYPRYTLAERMVLGFITAITWPVERFVTWLRRKVASDLHSSADHR